MDEEGRNPLEQIPDLADLEEQTLTTLYLEQFVKAMWPEVRLLPLKQRWALLLHFEKDEIMAFVQQGCCSLRQFAQVLETSPEEFAELFARLPLPDAALAERLEVTQRQVINLRKCARERLSRRLKVWGNF